MPLAASAMPAGQNLIAALDEAVAAAEAPNGRLATGTGDRGGRREPRLPPHFKPAVGALLTGAVGLVLYFAFRQQPSVLAVLSFGYGSLQEAFTNPTLTSAAILVAIALGKILPGRQVEIIIIGPCSTTPLLPVQRAGHPARIAADQF